MSYEAMEAKVHVAYDTLRTVRSLTIDRYQTH